MSFFKDTTHKILSLTICYKFITLIKSIYLYISDYNTIADVFYSDGFKKMLNEYLHVEIDKDWIGRLYGVINPNIDIDGNYNPNNIIIELNDDYTNNNEYVKTWIYKQLNLVAQLFSMSNLYNYISLDIDHIGPINADNYLLVFDIASRKNMVANLNKFLIQLFIYILIFVIIFFVFINK